MTIDLPGLPPLHWTGAEGTARTDPDTGALSLVAAAGVDWTNDAATADTGGRGRRRPTVT